MAKAKVAFIEWDDDAARSVTFEKGDPVPDHIARKVGTHVLTGKVGDEGGEVDTSAFDGDAFDAAVEAKAGQLADEKVQAALADQREKEQAAFDSLVDGDDFDPAADGVKAEDVKGYLEGLDRDTVAGSYEFGRVTDAEKAGPNRKSALVE